MTRNDVFQIISNHWANFSQFKVSAIFIFGSFARDEAKPSSDVDILVEFHEPIGLFEFVRLKKYFETILNRNVDLVTKDALKPQLRAGILKEALRAA